MPPDAPRPKRTRHIACACCGIPVAEIQGDILVITQRHHGKPHQTLISLQRLQELLQGPAKTEAA